MIGIIAVLVAILLPAVLRVRESARRTVCLSHIRTLTQATLAYAADNDRVLPEAVSTNSVQDPLCPKVQFAPAWHAPALFFPNAYVLPTIGSLLAKYVGPDVSVWRCPDTWDNINHANSNLFTGFAITGDNPYSGWQPRDVFLPNYNYESFKDYLNLAIGAGSAADPDRLRVWTARNVSGLRIDRAVPIPGTNQNVVLFHDRDSTYHSRGHVDVYTTSGDWQYYANYGYLDGHAEGQSYHNVNEYLAQIHGPIPQQWFGQDFQHALPEQYAPPH